MLSRLLKSLQPHEGHFDRESASYERLRARGFAPDAIIDVGAYEGHWARNARRIFGPGVPVLMVEPQAAKRAALARVCADMANTSHAPHVLSARAGDTVTFYEMETGSSLMPERSDAPRNEVRHVTETLDAIAPPGEALFLKIDAQGAELQILAGGGATLARCALVQLEAGVAHYNEGAPTLREVLAFMEERGFRMIDIAGRSRIQGMLVQIDLLFVPEGSPLLRDYFAFGSGDG